MHRDRYNIIKDGGGLCEYSVALTQKNNLIMIKFSESVLCIHEYILKKNQVVVRYATVLLQNHLIDTKMSLIMCCNRIFTTMQEYFTKFVRKLNLLR